jgi:predicted transcriptional regulator
MTALAHENPLLPFSIRLRKDQKTRLSAIAKAQDRTAHAIAAKALSEFIEREEARLSFKSETDAAWQHYQETGLHATQDELFAWMDSMFTDNQLPVPVCHK